jgi:hypothetical protein
MHAAWKVCLHKRSDLVSAPTAHASRHTTQRSHKDVDEKSRHAGDPPTGSSESEDISEDVSEDVEDVSEDVSLESPSASSPSKRVVHAADWFFRSFLK